MERITFDCKEIGVDVLSLLKKDHEAVSALLDEANACEPGDDRLGELADAIESALTVHASAEERLFYPELRDRAEDTEDTVDVFEAFTEHDVLKHLIAVLRSAKGPAEEFKAQVQVLSENVKHHVKEEESTIFALARELLDPEELEDIGERVEREKERLSSGAGRSPKRASGKKQPGKKQARKSSPPKRTPARKTARKAARKKKTRR